MNDIPRRRLGRTGEMVSIVGVGGFHIGKPADPKEAIAIVRGALDAGVNFLDNCWDYNGGASEERMGLALQDGYRQKAFLMTKIDGHTAEAATRQLDESLRRLKVDHVDLLQFHEVIRPDDPEKIFAPGGAMEGVRKAQEAGKVRYIGFTGHKSPHIHKHMLDYGLSQGFTFDAVQMPLNVLDAHFDSFETIVLPMLVEHDIGVLGMKPMGDGFIMHTGAVSAIECLHYTMSLPTSVTITGIDSLFVLDQALRAARTFRPFTPGERADLLARTAEVAAAGKYELYKTSAHFDGTTANPHWLG